MPTLWHPTYVTFDNGVGLLHAGTPRLQFDPVPFAAAGDARGGNRVIPGVDGRRTRTHRRDEATVDTLCRIVGRVDDQGDAVPPAERDVLSEWFTVRDFFESAEGRQLEVTLHHNGASTTGDVTYRTHGTLEFRAGDVLEVRFLFGLPDGLLPAPDESS